MPNLTSYHPPPIHLNRELPKTFCDLIRHEIDYKKFLRTRLANVHSSLPSSYPNKQLNLSQNLHQHKYFDHNQRLFNVYEDNLKLCQKLLKIWTINDKRKGGIDCHNEFYKKQMRISHFRSLQKQVNNKIENENTRLIRSLVSNMTKYRPIHDRHEANRSYKNHLKLLKSISEYSNVSPNGYCRRLPFYYKQQKSKCFTNPKKFKYLNKIIEKPYQNYSRQTLDRAIYIYNQPVSSRSVHAKPFYRRKNRSSRSSLYYENNIQQSFSCRQIFEPWKNYKAL